MLNSEYIIWEIKVPLVKIAGVLPSFTGINQEYEHNVIPVFFCFGIITFNSAMHQCLAFLFWVIYQLNT